MYSFLMIIFYSIYQLLTFYEIILFLSVLLSWVIPKEELYNGNKVLRFLFDITEPFLDYIRKFIPTNIGMIDFSPMIALMIVEVLKYFLSILMGF